MAKKEKVPKIEVAPVPVVSMAPGKKDDKPLVSYILVFTIEGHRTYRISLYAKKEDLDIYLKSQPKHPKFTDKKWFKVDRITGVITPEN